MNQRDISIIVGGVALGALLTSLFFKHRKSNLAMELEEDRRKSLPSMIILVRHGESEGNADHTLYRTTADNLVELTEHGSEDAKRTGKRIKDILGETKIHMIVSPFQRTLQTARNIRKSFESQIYHTYVDSRIREQEFGNLQGDDFKSFRNVQSCVGRFWYRFPTGESGADVYDRVRSWWADSVMGVNLRPGVAPVDGLVVVTHGLTMRFVLMQLYGWSPTTFQSVWNAGNCHVYVLRKDLMLPGTAPYRLDPTCGDMPRSSIELMVVLKSGEKRLVTLSDYLSVPAPRTIQKELVKKMLGEQHFDLDASDIVEIDFQCGKFKKYC